MIIQCIPVYLKSVILAMLALNHQRLVGVLRQGGVQIGPTTAGRSGDLATGDRICAQQRNQFTQLRSRGGVPARAPRKQLLERIGTSVLRADPEAVLTVLCNRQQLAQGYDGVTVVHGLPLGIDTVVDVMGPRWA